MSPVEYAIDAEPRRAVLGEPIVARLSCRATSHAAEALTFGHRSLVIELMRQGLAEPELAFPNRFAIEDAGRLVRMAAEGGVEELQAGEARTRSFDLLALFPHRVLAPGRLSVTYRLEEAEPIVRPEPIAVDVSSGPASVPRLIDHLGSDSEAMRFCAAELLAAMAANDFGFRADAAPADRDAAIQRWRAWWDGTGSHLPWSFDSEGATFGKAPGPAPESGLSGHLGGVAYPAPGPRSHE